MNEVQAPETEATAEPVVMSTDRRGRWFKLGTFSPDVLEKTRHLLPMPFYDEPPGGPITVIGHVVEIEGRGERDGAVDLWARVELAPGAALPKELHFFAPARRQGRAASAGSTVTTGGLVTKRIGPSDDEKARMKRRRKAARDARKRNR